jgi:hypothetical protein
MSDLYQRLGVSRTASPNEIKSAYRRMARKYHPDVNSDPSAARKFARLTEAYHILMDAGKRADYDRFGKVAASAAASRRAEASAASAARAARRAYYQSRADRVVNEWLEREREESRWRGQAVYTIVALFLSTFMVAMLKPSLFEDLNYFWKFALFLMFALGTRHLVKNIRRQLDHYTYRPAMISLMRYVRPQQPFSRGAAWAFIGGGYLVSLFTGMLMGSLTEDFTKNIFGVPSLEEIIFSVLFYPPIVVLIVDLMYRINLKFDEL